MCGELCAVIWSDQSQGGQRAWIDDDVIFVLDLLVLIEVLSVFSRPYCRTIVL